MVLSKRERNIAIATMSVVGIFALDYFAIEPLRAQKVDVDSRIEVAQVQQQKNTLLLKRRSQLSPQWSQMLNAGLRQDASEAEIRIQHNIHDWAQDSGMALSSLKTERSEKDKDFNRITIRATGTGSVSQLGHFLWRVQNANVPVRITDLTVSPRKEGADDLSITLGISTIALSPEAEKSSARPAAATLPRENNW